MYVKPSAVVLLAEDDPDDQKWIVAELRKCSLVMKVEVVKDGEELLSYLTEHRANEQELPALILLDINMPRKTGLEALEEIRSDPQLRKIPIVILTVSDTEESVLQSYLLGVNAYIKKPSDRAGLVSLIENVTTFWLQIAHLPNHRAQKVLHT